MPRPEPETRGEAIRRIQLALRRLTHEMHRLNDAVGSLIDLLPGDLEVLDLIGRDGPMPPRDVVAATGIHPATLTGMLDRLENGGWLTRSPDPSDRRRVLLEAMVERESEVARLYGPMSRAVTAICGEFSDEDLARIVTFLESSSEAGVEAAATIRDTAGLERTDHPTD